MFDGVLFTVAYFFAKNPNCEFVTTYQVFSPWQKTAPAMLPNPDNPCQERNVDRSLWHLALKWGMEVEEIPRPPPPTSSDQEVTLARETSVHLLLIRPKKP